MGPVARYVSRCTPRVVHGEASRLEQPLEVVHLGRAEGLCFRHTREQLDVPSLQTNAD
jgi:hypothetical protein